MTVYSPVRSPVYSPVTSPTVKLGSVSATAPVNTVLPAITGNTYQGQTLSVTNGTWDDGGSEITGYTYQWLADDVNIAGATSSTYQLTASENGAVITCTVTATNGVGSTGATSAGTDTVAANPVRTYRGTVTDGGSIAIGDAAADRLVIVCPVHTRTGAPSRTISSVTIDGTAGTLHGQEGSSGFGAGIASRVVATGTSITISWALSGAVSAEEAAVYTVTGLGSATPTDSIAIEGDDPTATLDLPANGVLIAVGGKHSTADDIAWTGLDTIDDAGSNLSIYSRWSAGNTVPTDATTDHDITLTTAESLDVIVAVAFA